MPESSKALHRKTQGADGKVSQPASGMGIMDDGPEKAPK
jgi:hypothetical protein